MFSIIAFVIFLLAIFYNESITNLYLWPICIIIFSALFFASYNLQDATTITVAENTTILNSTESRTVYEYDKDVTYVRETAFSWMFLGLALLSLILFIWDIWSKWNSEN
jgi:hypothetical protein